MSIVNIGTSIADTATSIDRRHRTSITDAGTSIADTGTSIADTGTSIVDTDTSFAGMKIADMSIAGRVLQACMALQAGHCKQGIAGRALQAGHCRQGIAYTYTSIADRHK